MSLKISFYLFFFLLFSQVIFASAPRSAESPLAVNGVIDLRNQSFTDMVPLNGKWKFYWNQLLDPAVAENSLPEMVDFPVKWTNLNLNGRKFPSKGYATYRLRILLPGKPEVLRLAMPEVYSSYKLFINGKEAESNGRVSSNPENFVPYWEHKFIDIDKGTRTVDLVLQIANFAHNKGGISKPILLGQKKLVILERRRIEAIDLLLTGCLFMGGFFFLGLFLLGNRDKAILFFSLFSVFYSYRIIGADNYVLHTVMPDIRWYITVRLEYFTFFISMGLFAIYTYYLYPKDINKYILGFICIVCGTFSVAAAILPPFYFSSLINPFLLLLLFCLIYLPYIYIRAYKNKRPGAGYSLISICALILVFTISLFHFWGIIPQFQIVNFAGYVSFFFLQSLVLSHRVSFQLIKARRQAEQGLRAKSEFLSTMSHEIRTPLNSVIGMSHLLLKSDPRPDQVEQLDVMLFSANNLLAIVNDILDFNKIEAGKITFENIEMDIAAIAKNIVKGLQFSAQDRGIELRLEVDKSLQNKVIGDPTRMFQVITNLVHNAIKFTAKGHVELSLEVKAQTAESITLKFRVKDTGIGISAENQKRIFERFTQADSSTSRGFGGTGLGLAICKRILELQNSRLRLQSETGLGSVFYFTQTFQKSIKTASQQEHENNLPKQEDKPFSGMHMLLVDDNPMNVMVAQNFLQRWGAAVDTAANGLEAVNQVDETRHRLVLIDLHMPVMDGYEATRQMRINGISIPIIALTANLPSEIEQDIHKAGMDDLVVKPFLPDELYRKVLNQLYKN